MVIFHSYVNVYQRVMDFCEGLIGHWKGNSWKCEIRKSGFLSPQKKGVLSIFTQQKHDWAHGGDLGFGNLDISWPCFSGGFNTSEKYERPIVVTSSHMFHSSAYHPHYETSVALWDDDGWGPQCPFNSNNLQNIYCIYIYISLHCHLNRWDWPRVRIYNIIIYIMYIINLICAHVKYIDINILI